jgi:hypothetical protein
VSGGLPDVLAITWLGADGSVWDLLHGTEGVWLAEGVKGFEKPDVTQVTQTATRVPGRQYLRTIYKPREVDLNLGIGDIGAGPQRTGRTWRDLKQQFLRSMSPEMPGRLLVQSDSGGVRYLDCRLDSAPDPLPATDPGLQGFLLQPVTLVSDSAFWSGLDVTRSFLYDVQPVNYYSGAAGVGGSVVTISRASQLSSATVNNPGDHEVFPRWTLTGPGTPTFGVGEQATTLPPLNAGDVIMVDTDPTRATVVNGLGQSVFRTVRARNFSVPLPSGLNVPLHLNINGGAYMTSGITVAFTPLFNEAT